MSKEYVLGLAKEAKAASRILSRAPTNGKNKAISVMAQKLEENKNEIREANQQDGHLAKAGGLEQSLVDRLKFGEAKIASRIKALREIILLTDPIGAPDSVIKRPNGLEVKRVRVPIGVIGMIYESRPHVTINAGALCLKSGNAVLLRGGSETINTNIFLGRLWQEALKEAGLPKASIQVVETTDHEDVWRMLELDEYIDLVIPRGGKRLIKAVRETSRIPVIKHYEGICHIFVDSSANLDMAIKISLDSKILMPEVCNAMETLLVDEQIAGDLLPSLGKEMKAAGVTLCGCKAAREIIPWAEEATGQDWVTEYLDMILSVRVVSGIGEAIEHIDSYGSHHTDAIVSENFTNIRKFETGVDSAVVLVNASTMFCDGGELGMGAEIGISTDKIHARGPVGLRDLTSYKYVVTGTGHVMEEV